MQSQHLGFVWQSYFVIFWIRGCRTCVVCSLSNFLLLLWGSTICPSTYYACRKRRLSSLGSTTSARRGCSTANLLTTLLRFLFPHSPISQTSWPQVLFSRNPTITKRSDKTINVRNKVFASVLRNNVQRQTLEWKEKLNVNNLKQRQIFGRNAYLYQPYEKHIH